MEMARIIRCARGEEPADLLLKNARVVNVFTSQIDSGSLAVAEGRILGLGNYKARKTVDLSGRYVCPGFIDAHVHIESAMVAVPEFVRAVLPRGTTTVVADPHEIANVLGTDGIRYMLAASKGQPMNLYFTLPSCVPATDMETAGASLSADDLLPFFAEDRILALGEMMNFPGVLAGVPDILRKIQAAKDCGKQVDGHSPGLTGQDLNAYLSAGIASDHECSTAQEAAEKLAAGMRVMIREGTAARNLDNLLPVVTEQNHHRMMWCTDDRHPHDLLDEGGIDAMVRRAIAAGIDPIIAIRMATLNPAQYFSLNHLGAVSPGLQADLLVLSDLTQPHADMVFNCGIQRAQNGEMLEVEKQCIASLREGVKCPPSPMSVPLEKIDLRIPATGRRILVIELTLDQIITRHGNAEAAISDQWVVADPSRDLLKIAVVERYTGKGGCGVGFVRGFNLKEGAIASSVAHDSHNLIVVGASDSAMMAALKAVKDMGGGLAAARDGEDAPEILATLPLPIAGLMSDAPLQEVRKRMEQVMAAARNMGCRLADPFMALSFLALPVIPLLKITDKGLVDVDQFKQVPLFLD